MKSREFQLKPFLLKAQSYIALVVLFIIGSLVCVRNGRNMFLSVTNIMNLLRAVSETVSYTHLTLPTTSRV